MPDSAASAQPALAIRCADLRKSYGHGDAAVQALRGVNLEVHAGELLMLIGPSGCGKTTLISVIAGVLRRDAGQCLIFDHDYARMSEDQTTSFRGRNIGFVFQSFNLIPTLSTEENVATPLIINGAKLSAALNQARQLLAAVGLDQRMMRALPTALSGGQQQRVAIARSLIHHPRLIVCDEPTSALDAQTGRRIMELLRQLGRDENRALVVVTHDSRILEFADRIAEMEDGRITQVTDTACRPNQSPSE